MFCKHCGSVLQPNTPACTICNAPVGMGQNYCASCGQMVYPNTPACPRCGYPMYQVAGEQKSKMAAGLLGIFLGGLGIHNFYLGYTGKAIAQILLSFCCGIGAIWGLVEGIMILCGCINTDAKGVPLKE